MLSFKEEHKERILKGIKTQTRRIWSRRNAKPGALHWATTNRYKSENRFARLEILSVHKERLGDITEEDAYKEGGYSIKEFKRVWEKINGEWNPDLCIYVVEFKIAWKCCYDCNTLEMLKRAVVDGYYGKGFELWELFKNDRFYTKMGCR